MQKTSAVLLSAVKNKIWAELKSVHFGQIQYFFKFLKTENQSHNSIPRGNPTRWGQTIIGIVA